MKYFYSLSSWSNILILITGMISGYDHLRVLFSIFFFRPFPLFPDLTKLCIFIATVIWNYEIYSVSVLKASLPPWCSLVLTFFQEKGWPGLIQWNQNEIHFKSFLIKNESPTVSNSNILQTIVTPVINKNFSMLLMSITTYYLHYNRVKPLHVLSPPAIHP